MVGDPTNHFRFIVGVRRRESMHLNTGLFQQQTLKLAMTQELSQAITLLQYSTQDLGLFLENKAAENPLISIEHKEVESSYKRNKKHKTKQKASSDWIEQIGEIKVSLEEYLFSQIHPASLAKREYHIARQLIHNLDENGYLRIDIQDVAKLLNEDEERITHVLWQLQMLEPAGVAARNLKECLLLQLKRKVNDPVAFVILNEHFEAFANKKWRGIAKELQITLQDIQEIFDLVQTLDPRPCSRFSNESPSYIVPDVYVELVEGELVTKMQSSSLNLSFNDQYYTDMRSFKDKQVNHFLQEKSQEYQWIARAIQQRRETILKIMTVIADKQYKCLLKGFAHLRPMTMKEVADELNIHESTVSRAVKDKYVQAPCGTIEMREFFSSSLQTTMCEEVSAREAKGAIQELIAKEDKGKPLSDQQIVNSLRQEQGIALSRRTVAKYRVQLKIPASSRRKRFE